MSAASDLALESRVEALILKYKEARALLENELTELERKGTDRALIATLRLALDPDGTASEADFMPQIPQAPHTTTQVAHDDSQAWVSGYIADRSVSPSPFIGRNEIKVEEDFDVTVPSSNPVTLRRVSVESLRPTTHLLVGPKLWYPRPRTLQRGYSTATGSRQASINDDSESPLAAVVQRKNLKRVREMEGADNNSLRSALSSASRDPASRPAKTRKITFAAAQPLEQRTVSSLGRIRERTPTPFSPVPLQPMRRQNAVLAQPLPEALPPASVSAAAPRIRSGRRRKGSSATEVQQATRRSTRLISREQNTNVQVIVIHA